MPKVRINSKVDIAICFRKGSSFLASFMDDTFIPLKNNNGVVNKNKNWIGDWYWLITKMVMEAIANTIKIQ